MMGRRSVTSRRTHGTLGMPAPSSLLEESIMFERDSKATRRPPRRLRSVLIALSLALVAWPLASVASAAQREFATPEEAVTALIDAVKANNQKALLDILGPQSRPLVFSGDSVADKNAGQRFVAEYDAAHRLQGGGGKVVLYVGTDDFPFAIPLVPDGPMWRFDTPAGKEEILNRRIGENELDTIQVCLAYVDAQRDYASEDRNADGIREYAQKFTSASGKRDGLYWETKPGEPLSPLGPVIARARAEGYGGKGASAPYHGYYYRILTAQGSSPQDGAYNYIAHGRMIGGFAMVAFPAEYGVSGIMTFIVNHDGVVYEKNLGPKTAPIARAMNIFNPDSTWKAVTP